MIREWLIGIVVEAIERVRAKGFKGFDGRTTLTIHVETKEAEAALERLQTRARETAASIEGVASKLAN